MGTPLSDLVRRLLALPVGRSLVANVRRGDAYPRRHAAGSEGVMEAIYGKAASSG